MTRSLANCSVELKDSVNLVEVASNPGGSELVSLSHATKASSEDLVDLARQIQQADSFVQANVNNQLQVIVDQVRYLQEQAYQILQKARDDADLNRVACNLVKKPGTTYSLYKRPTGQRYFSLVAPEEWGATCPHEFLGAYRLEADYSWTPVNKIHQRDADAQLIARIVQRADAFPRQPLLALADANVS